MKSVIHIPENNTENDKPVEFTHHQSSDMGWKSTNVIPKEFNKIVYLGKCSHDGHMFACYRNNGAILICKGHLNSGKY